MNEYSIFILKNFFKKQPSFMIDGKLFYGEKSPIKEICTKCPISLSCQNTARFSTCKHGIKTYTKQMKSGIYTFFIGEKSSNEISLEHLANQIENTISDINEIHLKQRSDDLHIFHDAVKYAKQISIATEYLIESRTQGATFAEKVKQADSNTKSLYHASKLLEESFEMMSILLNPEKIKFGKKITITPYQMFDKVSSILNISSEYKSSRKRTIKLSGKSTKKVEAFNSIVIIAHALLQNAIKYSYQENIDVELEDIEEGIEIRVTSIGPHIKIEDQDKIFQKGYRCDIAKRLHSDGMGIGLYIAQRIAQAHRTEIGVNSHKISDTIMDGQELAQNTFHLTLFHNLPRQF